MPSEGKLESEQPPQKVVANNPAVNSHQIGACNKTYIRGCQCPKLGTRIYVIFKNHDLRKFHYFHGEILQYRLNCNILGIYLGTKEICLKTTKKIKRIVILRAKSKKFRDFHKNPTDPENGYGSVRIRQFLRIRIRATLLFWLS